MLRLSNIYNIKARQQVESLACHIFIWVFLQDLIIDALFY